MRGLDEHATEKQFMAAVVKYARLLGWMVYHTYDSRRSEPGFPDLVMARAGRIIFAELKSARGRVSKAQREWLEELGLVEARSNGTVQVCLWRPEDWLSGRVEEALR